MSGLLFRLCTSASLRGFSAGRPKPVVGAQTVHKGQSFPSCNRTVFPEALSQRTDAKVNTIRTSGERLKADGGDEWPPFPPLHISFGCGARLLCR